MEIIKPPINQLYNLDYNKIWSELNSRELSLRKVALATGMTPTGFRQSLEKQTLSVKQLEKLSSYLGVNPRSFFTETGSMAVVSDPIEHYQSPKQRAIEILKKIQELKEELRVIIEKNIGTK